MKHGVWGVFTKRSNFLQFWGVAAPAGAFDPSFGFRYGLTPWRLGRWRAFRVCIDRSPGESRFGSFIDRLAWFVCSDFVFHILDPAELPTPTRTPPPPPHLWTQPHHLHPPTLTHSSGLTE